mgnify:CR=1 FL=1
MSNSVVAFLISGGGVAIGNDDIANAIRLARPVASPQELEGSKDYAAQVGMERAEADADRFRRDCRPAPALGSAARSSET